MNRRRQAKGMNLSMAQVKWAFRELYGRPIASDLNFMPEANRMYKEHGREKIEKALTGYDFDAYAARTDL